MIFPNVASDLSWGKLMISGSREPLETRLSNLSYTDFLWELNHVKGAPSDASYTKGIGGGGSGNYYVGLITSVPYVRDGKKPALTGSHNQGKDNESIAMKGPWYVSYCGLDTMYDTGNGTNGKYSFHPDGRGNTYYADRIVLKQEMDYALDKNYVNKYQLGTYYTGVGLWWDSWNSINGGARNYRDLKEVPDGTYFTSLSYSEIFNDYTYNKATGNYAHAEGYHTYVVGSSYAHAEGKTTLITSSENAHAEGLSTVIDNAHEAHVEGNSTKAFNSAYSSHAEGTGSYTKGINAHAENSSYANGLNSHAGGEATAGGTRSFAHGVKGTLASGTNSVALVSGTASGENSVAISGGQATTKDSVAIGVGAKANTNAGAVALGKGTSTGTDSLSANTGKSNGTRSVAMNNATASGTDSFAANASTASGVQSTALNASKAQSSNSFAANAGTASQDKATALNSATASGTNSLAGNTSSASGTNSTSLNNGSATGELSLASGHGTASGKGSHAEGESTTSKGTYSHAEGNHSVTEGNYAHTEGNWTKTTNDYEHAEGTFNQSYTGSDTQSASLFEIGDGTADNTRHNVVSVWRNGTVLVDSKNNAYLAATNDISINGKKTVHITSPSIVTTTDTNHLHSNNYVCIRGNVSTYLKGSTTTYIGKDQEGNLTLNTYVVGNKKTEYITGNLEETTTGTTTTKRTGAVTITNSSTVNETTNGKITETFTKGRSTTVSEGNSLTVNGLESERYNNERQSYVTGGCYMYVSEEVGTYIKGASNLRIDGKSTVSVAGGRQTTISGNNSTSISTNDTLSVSGNKTDTIVYDYAISSTSTYIRSSHITIGDPAQIANGLNSVTIGNNNTATNQASVSIGENNNTSGQNSVLLGTGLRSNEYSKVSVGEYNKSYTEAIFEVGVGTKDNDRKNAFTTYKTGVTYFHYQPYVYDSYINTVTNNNTPYKRSEYPDQSVAVSMSYFQLCYTNSFIPIKKYLDNINKESVKTINGIDKDSKSFTLKWTSQNYDSGKEKYSTTDHTLNLPSATQSIAGLHSAQDKRRIDNLWSKNYNGDDKYDCIKDIKISGDTITYNGWDLNLDYDQLSTGVRLKYTKSNGTTNTALTTIPIVNEGAKTSGVISSAQYKSLLDRITYLETWTIWKARVGTETNTSTYLWSGSLDDFNAIKTKPTDTTFIVTN